MDAFERKGVLLDLIDRLNRGGSWCGETHIQKSVYFLQELLGVPLDFNTIFYKHGPYSFDLADELVSLIAAEGLMLSRGSRTGQAYGRSRRRFSSTGPLATRPATTRPMPSSSPTTSRGKTSRNSNASRPPYTS